MPASYTTTTTTTWLSSVVLFLSWTTVASFSHPAVVVGQPPVVVDSSSRRPTRARSPPLPSHAQTVRPRRRDGHHQHHQPSRLYSSFSADGSEYSSDKSDFEDDNNNNNNNLNDAAARSGSYRADMDEDDTPTTELQPVPMSKNGGNRFVAFVWDRVLQRKDDKDALDRHYDRIRLTEEHVMFCRKQNLYNATFNQESMVDILWSMPILSSDLQRVIGHAMCLESTQLDHVQSVLARDPIVQMLTNGDITHIPLYRWRHIRDYSLRIDDGRDGFPCLLLGMDDASAGSVVREEIRDAYLECLIRSERVIAAGPLHLPTEFKDDPSSLPAGDLIMFNAKNREDAIDFAESLPSAQAGLYDDLRVHFYNRLDVTGKFVSEDPLRDSPGEQMKEAMEYWGYPVKDEETPWINW